MVGDLGQRHVRRSRDQGEDLCSMPFKRAETPVATLRFPLTAPVLSPLTDSSIACRRRHAEPAAAARQLMPLIFTARTMRRRRSGEEV